MTSTATRFAAAAILAVLSLASLPGLPAQAASSPVGGTYHPLQPARILDTRDGTGGVPAAPLQAGGQLTVQVAGRGLVPASGAAAVVMNVTATNTTAAGFLTVFPAGVVMPLASNLNWVGGQTIPNLVAVALGTGAQAGQVTVYNDAGSADVIFDVAGYYTTPPVSPGPDGLFNPVVPSRLLDTRTGDGAPAAKLGQAQALNLQVTGRGGVPGTGVSAAVLNVTVTGPTVPSYLTVWPTAAAMPLASNLNFSAGQTVPNRVIVAIGSGGQVSIFNALGATDVVVDVNGWFTDASGTSGSRFVGMAPMRILDTRNGNGGLADPWGPNTGRALTVAGVGGVPNMTDPNPPTAVLANITVTDTTAPSYLTAWPDGAAQPLTSDLNWTSGTVPNLAVVQVGPTGKIDIYNGAGCTDVVVDVVGWFTGPIPVTAAGPPPTAFVCRYLFGTLETDPNRASQEYAAGFRIAEQTVGWNNYEPQDGVFDAGYITSIKQRIQTFQRAGLKVVISPAIQYPPAWVFSLPGSRYVNQYGAAAPATWAGFEEPNVVFSQAVRDRVAGFETKVMQELGPGNIWAVRYVNGSLGEVLYPPADDLLGHNNSYWAYDANAQNNASADRPPGVPANPFPGWQPGQTTYNGQPFSVAQVQQWYEWYVDARMDFVNWHTKLFRDLGFTGYLQLQTPGFGVRPSEYAASTANFLDGTGDPNQTMGRAAIWQKVYAKLTDRMGVTAYVSSMADGSGFPQDQGCQSTDVQVDLEHDPQVNNWSAVRYVSYLADMYGMIKSGENPGSGDPNRNVVYGRTMLASAAAQMATCSFQSMFWAQDQNLYDGVSGVKPADFTALKG
jgi:hypothetical protein